MYIDEVEELKNRKLNYYTGFYFFIAAIAFVMCLIFMLFGFLLCSIFSNQPINLFESLLKITIMTLFMSLLFTVYF